MGMARESLSSAPNAVIILPTLNEAGCIAQTIGDLRANNTHMPIWVVDGDSNDGTQDCVRHLMTTDPFLRLMHNPHGHQSHATNIAAHRAMIEGFDVFIRADAHARYRAGFAAQMTALLDHTGAESITVPLIATGAKETANSLWQQANCALQHCWLGHGGAFHRRGGQSGWVDHGHHAAFRTARFLALGGYDSRFKACEDVDYDIRLRASGGRIWFAADHPVDYLPRATPRATFDQMRRNGVARGALAHKHHSLLGLRQFLPLLACAALLISPLGLIAPFIALPAAAYLLLISVLALTAGMKTVPQLAPRIAVLALLSHMGFAMGLLGYLHERYGPLRRRKSKGAIT